jgi:hypothetical protein
MNGAPEYGEAVKRLKALLVTQKSDKGLQDMIAARDDVLQRYGPMFQRDNLEALTEDAFRGFLMPRNNRHWSGLQRLGPRIVENMEALRAVLYDLLDEEKSASERIAAALPNNKTRVKGLSKAILTPILLISAPDRFSVWNGISEQAMQELKVWPDLCDAKSVAEQYVRINEQLLNLARDVGCDLWTLDALLWRVLNSQEGGTITVEDEEEDDETTDPDDPRVARFGLERQLHDFLLEGV